MANATARRSCLLSPASSNKSFKMMASTCLCRMLCKHEREFQGKASQMGSALSASQEARLNRQQNSSRLG